VIVVQLHKRDERNDGEEEEEDVGAEKMVEEREEGEK
jgi:hypothetical protein